MVDVNDMTAKLSGTCLDDTTDSASAASTTSSSSNKPKRRERRAPRAGYAGGIYRPPGAVQEERDRNRQRKIQDMEQKQQTEEPTAAGAPPPVQQQQQRSNNRRRSSPVADEPDFVDFQALISCISDQKLDESHSLIADNVRLLSAQQGNDSDSKALANALVDCVCEYGSRHIDLAVFLTLNLTDIPELQYEISVSIRDAVDNRIYSPDFPGGRRALNRAKYLCELMGRLIIGEWPRDMRSPQPDCNAVLSMCLQTLFTWCTIIQQEQSKPDTSAFITGVCRCVLFVCHCVGRDLWLCWPEEVDTLWAALQTIIVANDSLLDLDVKKQLLNQFVQLNIWPLKGRSQASRAGLCDAQTQTEV